MPKELREHQELMRKYAKKIASDRRRGFRMLAHVVCGGGKSWLPCLLMESMPSDVKLCWVVPRLALQEQATIGSLEDFGLHLRDAGNDDNPSRNRRGVVVTHQAVSQNVALWEDEFKRHKYILLIDEPHHAKVWRSGEKNALAKFIEKVEPYALGTVYMTGTLTTGDSGRIYGIEYKTDDAGKETPSTDGFDYVIRYTRKHALAEKAIVKMEFFFHDGPVKWECLKSGEVTQTMLSEADKESESNAIWTALSTELAESLFERGYAHWKSNGNKLLVVCDSQANAKKWHKELLHRGESAFLAVSENDEAMQDIKRFKKTPRSVLVTCAMAYEGLDEKPLSHVISLTHIRSVPWIEQMLARVWRMDHGKSVCYAFVTDDPRMRRVIDKIKSEEPDAKSTKPSNGGGDGPGERSAAPVASRHELTRLSGLDHEVAFAVMNTKQQKVYEELTAVGIDPNNEHLIGILKALQTIDTQPLFGSLTDRELEKNIRQLISNHCRRIDRDKFNSKWGSMYKELYRRNGCAIEELNLDQLRKTLQYVESISA
jgi:superfamily II DNA or RNA helicase